MEPEIDYDSVRPFEDIEVEWRGKKNKIPSNQIMPLLKQLWEHVNYKDIQAGFANTNWPSFTCAYANILRAAGFSITDDHLWQLMNKYPEKFFRQAFQTVQAIFALTIAPEEVLTQPKKPKARAKKPRKKKPTKAKIS